MQLQEASSLYPFFFFSLSPSLPSSFLPSHSISWATITYQEKFYEPGLL